MKKSYYCEKLEKTLHFLPDEIKFCCSCTEGLGIKLEGFSNINKEKIYKTKEEYIEKFKKGIVPQKCVGCPEYKERGNKFSLSELFQSKNINKVEYIIVDHFKQCDCDCVYCSQAVFYPNVLQNYELLPLVKQLYSKNMIGQNLHVEFQGGNISLLKEFNSLVNEFQQHGCKKFTFISNMIKNMPELQQISSVTDSYICVSLDSGKQETFKKIKGLDAFNSVTQNIRELTVNSSAKLKLKYIVLQGLNDNSEELRSFLEFAKSLPHIDCVILDIDYRDTFMPKEKRFDVPQHYYQLFEMAENYCKENNLPFYTFEHTKAVLNAGYAD